MMRFLFFLLVVPFWVSAQESFNMTLLSNYDPPDMPTRFGIEYSDCWGFRHANGTEVAIIGGIEDILFVDVTAPANPVLIYSHHVENASGTDNQSAWRDFMTFQNYVYAAADEGTSGLLIFDMSQVPTSITMVTQTQAFFNRTHTIFLDELHGRLYAGGSNTVSNGLVILDVLSSPTNPTLEALVPLNGVGGGYVHDMYVRDNIAYCSHGSLSKIQMYDFSDLPNFDVVGVIDNYPEAGYNHSSWLNSEGNQLVMCDETHGSDVKLVDVSDPLNISSDDFNTFYSELLGPNVPNASVAHNPFILGDLAYIAYYHDGVQIYDISDPENVESIAYYDTYPDNEDYNDYIGCWGVYPFLPSGTIIASDMNYGLYMLEITELPLAIDFLSFQAYRKNEGVKLDWTVADASFGNQFEVMRSSDGGVHFQTIGTVQLSEFQTGYTFIDHQASTTSRYVYRIDFIQLDGSRIKSPLRYVRSDSKDIVLKVVNPMTTGLIIDVMIPMENLALELYDMEGRSMWKHETEEPKARMEFEMDLIPAGQYILMSRWETGSENLIIQKVK